MSFKKHNFKTSEVLNVGVLLKKKKKTLTNGVVIFLLGSKPGWNFYKKRPSKWPLNVNISIKNMNRIQLISAVECMSINLIV